MSVMLYIQDGEGNNNYEGEFFTDVQAEATLAQFQSAGGYWVFDRYSNRVFVPWHKVDFARLEKVNP